MTRDGLSSRFFARESRRGVPMPALLVAAVVNSLLVLANYTRGMVGMFTFMVLLTTLGNVVAYPFSAMADVVLAYRAGRPVPRRGPILACAAFGFSIWAVFGAGADAAYWNPILLVLGLPVYVWQTRHTSNLA